MKNYKQTMGKMKNEDYMVSENMSDPSNMPRGNKSVMYADVECGGVMADDSVKMSDKESNEMASKLRKQIVPGKF